jgi:hypothetical protein
LHFVPLVLAPQIRFPFFVANRTTTTHLCSELREADVETVVPRGAGARVRLVAGAHRNELGSLLERSTEHNRAVVQLARLAEVVTVSLDDVCGFVA